MKKKLPELFRPMLKLSVAVLTIIILIFSILSIFSTIQTQIRQKDLQLMALKQASQQIEDFIASAEQLGIVVQNNSQLMAYNINNNINLPHNIVWEMEMLSPSVNSLNSLGILYIDSIYPEINGLIYSSLGRYTLESYCQQELENALTAEQLNEVVRNAQSSTFVTELLPSSKSMLYVLPIPSQYLFSPGRLLLKLDAVSFTRGLRELAVGNSDVYVYDSKGNLLIYFGNDHNNDIALARSEPQTIDMFNGKTVFRHEIDKYGINVVQVLNSWNYYQPTIISLFSIIALAAIILLLGIKAIYVLAHNTAQPLTALVQRVSHIGNDTTYSDEFDEITRLSNVFEGLVTQQEQLTTAMESRKKLEETQYLLSLLGCSNIPDVSTDIIQKYTDIITHWASFGMRVLVFRFDDTIHFLESFPPKGQWSIKSALRHEFDTMCSPLGFGKAVDLPSGQGIAALAAFQGDIDFAKSADYTREALCRISGLSMSCGISNAVYCAEDLPKAFKEAVSNCRYRLFHSGSTITPEYVASIRTQRTRLSYEGANDILQAVKNCNHPEISRGVGKFFADITGAASLPSYKLAYFDMLSHLNKLIRECSEKSQNMLINMLDLLYENCYESTDVLQRDLYEFCILLSDTLCDERAEHLQAGLLGSIYTYIEEHFAYHSLSLSSIADALGFSPSYLTRYFKEKTGISLMQYIDKKRFEESKNLLTSTSLPIKSIVEQVGYTDEANFSRKFKSIEGVTPTQFRSMKKK